MDGRRWRTWGVVGFLLVWSGCLGYPDPLPPPLEESENSSAGIATTGVGTDGGATTGPIAECGNGDVEDGEECDGTDWSGATCESLGFSESGLMCTGCQLDVSRCGPPPDMVLVPGGVFEMGSTELPNEQPIRQVQVDTFWMDETEVTVEAYMACVADDACTEPGSEVDCNWMVAGREHHPVNCVTWYQAEDYCGWAGEGTKRLPTEAEWEKAARGTNAWTYPWGESPAPSCNYVVMYEGGEGCGMNSTWAVASKPVGDSPYGAHDMAGNVQEWVADWYADSYDAADLDNPTGPPMGEARVSHGGSSHNDLAYYFRASFRTADHPSYSFGNLGFRCARTPPAAL